MSDQWDEKALEAWGRMVGHFAMMPSIAGNPVAHISAALRAAYAQGVEDFCRRADCHLNETLCEMKEGYDDSIVGFNAAWDIIRALKDKGGQT